MSKNSVELFQDISEKLNDHVEKLNDHVERFEQHELEEMKKFDKLIDAQKNNTDAITELTESVCCVVEGTASIIQLHKDFQGAARVGGGVQRFMLWLLKWGAIGTGIVASMNWAIEHFTK